MLLKPLALVAVVSCAAMAFIPPDALAAGPDDKVWKQVEMVRVWKLAEVLDLSDQDMPKIVPVVQDYNSEMRKRAMERESILSNLGKELGPNSSGDDKQLGEDIRRVLALEKEMMSIRQDHYKKMQTLLNPEKLAKYMVFEVRFHDELQNFMSDMSRRRAKPGLGKKKPPEPATPQVTPKDPAN